MIADKAIYGASVRAYSCSRFAVADVTESQLKKMRRSAKWASGAVLQRRATKEEWRCCAALSCGKALTSYCFFGWLDVV